MLSLRLLTVSAALAAAGEPLVIQGEGRLAQISYLLLSLFIFGTDHESDIE